MVECRIKNAECTSGKALFFSTCGNFKLQFHLRPLSLVDYWQTDITFLSNASPLLTILISDLPLQKTLALQNSCSKSSSTHVAFRQLLC